MFALLAVLVVLFPVVFLGRVISPIDTIKNSPPWQTAGARVQVANPELLDTAGRLIPSLHVARDDLRGSAIVDSSAGCGQPGLLAWHRGMLSPLVVVWLGWIEPSVVPNLIVLGKIVAAFFGAYLLLRHLNISRISSSTGASVFSLSSPLAANWLSPFSSTMAFLPLTLWATIRLEDCPAPRSAIAVCALAWTAMAAGGDPSAFVLCCYLSLAFFLTRAMTARAGLHKRVAATACALLISGMVLSPAVVIWNQAGGPLPDSGHLASPGHLGLSAVHLLLDPFTFGDPRNATFQPPESYPDALFSELAVSVGVVAFALALIGGTTDLKRSRFWVAIASLALAALALEFVGRSLSSLPWLDRLSISHVGGTLALALSFLSGAGLDRLMRLGGPELAKRLGMLVTVAIILEQGLAASHLLPFLPATDATLRPTPGLDTIQTLEQDPYRISAVQNTLWPDASGALGLEDIRINQPVSPAYTRLIRSFDRQGWGYHRSVVRLNAATLDYEHPYLSALGVRWILEPPSLHLVEYALGSTVHQIDSEAHLLLRTPASSIVTQEIDPPVPTSRIGVPLAITAGEGRNEITITLTDLRTQEPTYHSKVSPAQIEREQTLWLDLETPIRPGQVQHLEIRQEGPSPGIVLQLTDQPQSTTGTLRIDDRSIKKMLALEFDTSGFSRFYDGPDIRVWKNHKSFPRFWPVRSLVGGTIDTLYEATPPIDLARTAVVRSDDLEALLSLLSGPQTPDPSDRIDISRASSSSYQILAELDTPAILVSSVASIGSLWRLEVDGQRAEPIEVNGLFVGIPLRQGRHEIELTPGLSPVWYGCSVLGATLLLLFLLIGQGTNTTLGSNKGGKGSTHETDHPDTGVERGGSALRDDRSTAATRRWV